MENETNENKKGNITERLASNRQVKFTELWTDFIQKIAEINQVYFDQLGSSERIFVSLEFITRT